jgi:hypothetical protein
MQVMEIGNTGNEHGITHRAQYSAAPTNETSADRPRQKRRKEQSLTQQAYSAATWPSIIFAAITAYLLYNVLVPPNPHFRGDPHPDNCMDLINNGPHPISGSLSVYPEAKGEQAALRTVFSLAALNPDDPEANSSLTHGSWCVSPDVIHPLFHFTFPGEKPRAKIKGFYQLCDDGVEPIHRQDTKHMFKMTDPAYSTFCSGTLFNEDAQGKQSDPQQQSSAAALRGSRHI